MNKINRMSLLALFLGLGLCSHAQTAQLDRVFAPVVVGIPPSDAYIGLSKMPDGEIRHYNYGERKEDDKPIVRISINGKKRPAKD